MSILNSYPNIMYGGLGFGGMVVTDQSPAPDIDKPAEELPALKRTTMQVYGGIDQFGLGWPGGFGVCGAESRMRAFDPPPIFSPSLCWRMMLNETIALAFTITVSPFLSGTRSTKCIDDLGDKVNAERIQKDLDKYSLPKLAKAMPAAAEKMNFGAFSQELVYGRVNGKTVVTDVRAILPLEAVLHQDSSRRLTAFQIGDQIRDARYLFHAVNKPHLDPINGYSRNRNALAAWWRYERSDENADRVERKASGIQMGISIPMGGTFYTTDENGKQTPIFPMKMAQDLVNLAAQGDSFVKSRFAFPKEAIEANPELAKVDAISVEQFDWGNNGPALLAHLSRMSSLEKRMMRAWCRPEREAMEGEHGTKAEAGTHGAIGTTDSELIHASICEQWDEQVTATYLRTNEDPKWIGCFKTVPAPLSDPQQEFLQQLYLALVADTTTGPDVAADIDQRALGSRVETPMLSEADADKKRAENDAKAQAQQKLATAPVNGAVNGNGKLNGNGDSDRVKLLTKRLAKRLG